MRRRVTISVYAGNLPYRDFDFDQEFVLIGRKPDSDIVLKHASVSGAHAKIDLRSMIVTDLDSSNGTYYDGKPIKTARIKFGKWVSIAQYHLMVSEKPANRELEHSATVVLEPIPQIKDGVDINLSIEDEKPAEVDREQAAALQAPTTAPPMLPDTSGKLDQLALWALAMLALVIIGVTAYLVF